MRKSISTVIVIMGVGWMASGDTKSIVALSDNAFKAGVSVGANIAMENVLVMKKTGEYRYKNLDEIVNEAISRRDSFIAGNTNSLNPKL